MYFEIEITTPHMLSWTNVLLPIQYGEYSEEARFEAFE